MSTPPPPPGGPGGFPQQSGFPQQPGFQQPGYPPQGYQPYGQPAAPPPGNSGMAIAGMVLSLVGLVPCFWLFQVPGVLGAIFGFIGLKQTKDNARRGRGMAITGVVVGILLTLACIAFWIYFSTNSNCVRNGSEWVCTTD